MPQRSATESPGSAGRWRRRSAEDGAATAVFDRLGSRVWTIAIAIVGDEERSKAIVVAALRRAALTTQESDASVLCRLRRQAIQAAEARVEVHGHSGSVPSAIASLPGPEREVIELVVLGRLSATAVAEAIGAPRPDVIRLIARGMRTLRAGLVGADGAPSSELRDAASLDSAG